jgi:hypothetical protein
MMDFFARAWAWTWDVTVRWRTWIVNALLAFAVFLPDLVFALLGFNWGTLLPKEYMPYVGLIVVVLNVLMRPRPASRAKDPEVQVAKVMNAAVKQGSEVIVKADGETIAAVVPVTPTQVVVATKTTEG